MVESERALPVSSAFVRVLPSNRWEAGPPPAPARSSTAPCWPRRELERAPGLPTCSVGTRWSCCVPAADARTPIVSSDEETSAEALIRNTCASFPPLSVPTLRKHTLNN